MSIPVCKFYSCNRNCKFGKHCKFLHSDIRQTTPLDLADQLSHHEELARNSHLCASIQSIRQSPVSTHREYENEVSVNLDRPDTFGSSQNSGKEYQDEKLSSEELSDARPSRYDCRNAHRNDQSRSICSHFNQHGWCKFGRGCKFSHVKGNERPHSRSSSKTIAPRFQKKETVAEVTNLVLSNEDVSGRESETTLTSETVVVEDRSHFKPRRLCKYFRNGYCYRGSKCSFSHDIGNKEMKELTGEVELNQEKEKSQLPKSSRRIIKPPGQPQILSLAELNAHGTTKYRELDICFLKKRYEVYVCHEKNLDPTDDFVVDLKFSPSDPDWPFDMNSFVLNVILVADYPKEPMQVRIPSEKQDLPETVRRCLESSITDWITSRHTEAKTAGKAELVARPFFKWLDRNLEDLMTDALTHLKRELTAKAAGLEFIPVQELKTRLQVSSPINANGNEDEDEDSLEDGDDFDESSDECLQLDSESEESVSDDDKNGSISTDKRGTEITLKHLQLKQNACALMISKLSLMVQCGRCKTVSTLALDQTTVVVAECSKCSHEMMAKYRPSLAHALSSVIGYLDLENCVAFDLVLQDCALTISCLACSKSTSIDGLVTGQVTDSWCKACNAKFKIATEAVKFYLLEHSTVVTSGSKIEKIRSKSKKSVKDPAIREGFPLPDEGTCRHYKQSYRWLRFPCCGKAYPCDVCHDKKEDHPMEMATRMICGHCSREQNFSATRPCVSCSSHLTKIKSAHWEGGSGCRDKIAMSRGDQQKYKNMNKTQSNHSKKVKAVGKKSTKLRHT